MNDYQARINAMQDGMDLLRAEADRLRAQVKRLEIELSVLRENND